MGIEPTLSTKIHCLRKRQYGENDNDGEIHLAEEYFRVNYFFVVVDVAITSLKNIFEWLEVFESIFEFLFDATCSNHWNNNDELKNLPEFLRLLFS
jgi:hypothetical protein